MISAAPFTKKAMAEKREYESDSDSDFDDERDRQEDSDSDFDDERDKQEEKLTEIIYGKILTARRVNP